jgi:hypothetical protein
MLLGIKLKSWKIHPDISRCHNSGSCDNKWCLYILTWYFLKNVDQFLSNVYVIIVNILKTLVHQIKTASRTLMAVSQLIFSCNIKSCLQMLISFAPNVPWSCPRRVPSTALTKHNQWWFLRTLNKVEIICFVWSASTKKK